MSKMKDSGIEWIGIIPEADAIIKFKYLIEDTNAGEVIDKSFWNRGEELLYTCQKTPMMSDYPSFPQEKRTKERDILLTRNATPYVFIPEINSIYSNVVQRVRVKQDYHIKYVSYAVLNGAEALAVNGDTIPSYNMEVWKNIFIPNIPYNKQKSRADYLDSRCSKIDSIISKQQQIIEKLKEYKLSVITEAVTKGINPNISMKDSNYDYIGDIPKHWEIFRLRNIGTLQNGLSKGGEFFGEGYPFVSYGDIYRNYSLPEMVSGLVQSSDEERQNYSVVEGDIFFTRTSETIEEVGFSCVCEKTIPDATFAGFVIRVRPFNDKLVTRYAKYYFRSEHHRLYLAKEMNLVTRASLSQDLLKSMPVLIPPKEEQIEIADYLDSKIDSIEKSINCRQGIINKLLEYKKALIYEVVTGKKEV